MLLQRPLPPMRYKADELEVHVQAFDMLYHDFLSLHRINGNWLIVNKIMSGDHQ